MSQKSTSQGVNSLHNLVYKLCYNLSGRNKEDATRYFRQASNILLQLQSSSVTISGRGEHTVTENVILDSQSSSVSISGRSEHTVTENLKNRICLIHGRKDEKSFTELYEKLKLKTPLQLRVPVLQFLSSMSEPQSSSSSTTQFVPALISAESQSVESIRKNCFELPTLSASVSSMESTIALYKKPSTSSVTGSWFREDSFALSSSQSSGVHTSRDASRLPKGPSVIVITETKILQDLIFIFQGINGRFIKFDSLSGEYVIDPKLQIKRHHRRMALRQAELGWCHNQIREFCENTAASKSMGLMGQSLTAALREELTEYYRLVALLQSQIKQQGDTALDSPLSEEQPEYHQEDLTLLRLEAWMMEPLSRMKCLVAVVQSCQGKKGGILASCLHGFLEHGDPMLRTTVKSLLTSVCRPLDVMLNRWILDGELDDPFSEFFICANPDVKGDMLWHKKYKVLEPMIPSFITIPQAQKILSTGKNINFLREICQDHVAVSGRDLLKQTLQNTSVEALFKSDREGDLIAVLDTVYLETSRRVLDVLMGHYKFLDHLQALRRYLLLGQGDFIRYLMELLEPELRKPASSLYPHNLNSILQSAIRATNAQFEDPDILNRLDVRMLEQSPGDTGWDVFSLEYHVDGPIGTVFAQHSTVYLTLFNALWRTKRMEWILSCMTKRQAMSSKLFRKLIDLKPILKQMQLLTAQMVHFIHQMQYYFLFEVLECSWAVLIRKGQQAESLDDVILAHETFLMTVKAGALLDENSRELAAQLRTVYDLILELKQLEEDLTLKATEEVKDLAKFEQLKKEENSSSIEDQECVQKRHDFKAKLIPQIRAQLKLLSNSYEDVVKKFLLMLGSQPDESLQLLSFRLDFNDYYKKLDSRLAAPLTYQHRRHSEMGLSKAASRNIYQKVRIK